MRKEVRITIKSKEISSQLELVRNSNVLNNALFVHAFGYVFELAVTGWCIIAA